MIKNIWMGVARNECGQSGHRTLKLAVSQEWIDAMNWFFAWWCKFWKVKSCFNDFWVGLVKNGHVHLGHDSLKSAEKVHRLSWFFTCWLWCNNFLLDQHCTFTFARNPCKVMDDNPIFLKSFFCPKNWGNGSKKGFPNLKKNLVLRCRPKHSQPIKLHNS